MTLEEILKDIMHANHHVSIWWPFKRKWRGPFKSSVESSPFQSLPVLPLKPGPCASPVDRLTEGMEGGGRALRKAPIRHHQAEQSSALMRTAERYNGLRRIAPEPRAPMPATKKPAEQLVKNQKYTPSDQKNKTCTLLCYPPTFLTSHHKSKANSEFFPYLHYYWLSTGEAI